MIGLSASSVTEQVLPVGMPLTVWEPPAATLQVPVWPAPQS